METVKTVEQLRQVITHQKVSGKRIAFVPTMGNLHQGHLELIRLARSKADYVVASIFVNPMQFGPAEDFDNYPRTIERDQQQLSQLNCDLLFLPTVETMYSSSAVEQTRVEVPVISQFLCGESRPGHFAGVATIVTKLFNLVQPDVAVFGQKDFQQLQIIRKMVEDLSMPIEIIGAPTHREADGLAMSSRNGYLDPSQRAVAPKLYQQLQNLAEQLTKGQAEFNQLEQVAAENLNQMGFITDYIAIRRSVDLSLPDKTEKQLVILAAVFLGKTRLIDNLVLNG